MVVGAFNQKKAGLWNLRKGLFPALSRGGQQTSDSAPVNCWLTNNQTLRVWETWRWDHIIMSWYSLIFKLILKCFKLSAEEEKDLLPAGAWRLYCTHRRHSLFWNTRQLSIRFLRQNPEKGVVKKGHSIYSNKQEKTDFAGYFQGRGARNYSSTFS